MAWFDGVAMADPLAGVRVDVSEQPGRDALEPGRCTPWQRSLAVPSRWTPYSSPCATCARWTRKGARRVKSDYTNLPKPVSSGVASMDAAALAAHLKNVPHHNHAESQKVRTPCAIRGATNPPSKKGGSEGKERFPSTSESRAQGENCMSESVLGGDARPLAAQRQIPRIDIDHLHPNVAQKVPWLQDSGGG